MALVNKNAAILVKDIESKVNLIPTVIELLANENEQTNLISAISLLGKPNATASIVDEIEKIVK